MAATLAQKCYFSGYEVYPGHGKFYIRMDAKTFVFQSGKTESFYYKKRNPRKISWTAAYRHVNKKGITVQQSRRRARRNIKVQRAIVGASLDQIRAKKTQKPEFRAAQREAAKLAFKEKRRAERQARREALKKAGSSGVAQKQQKAAQKAARNARKGGRAGHR
jgi:large subunit ribosomal protein L24e